MKNTLRNILTASSVIGLCFVLWSNSTSRATTNEPLRYVAILDQNGSNAPTANVIYNTLSGTPTFARIGAGHYQVLLEDGFPEGRTTVLVPPLIDGLDTYASAVYGSPDHIDILSMIDSGQISDGTWNDRWVEITVYPAP